MHAVLKTPELVALILGHLSSKDQTTISYTSSALWRIAREHVWKAVPGFSPILALFGPVVERSTGDILTFRRPLISEDWTRFNIYAPLIKTLAIDQDILHPSPTVFTELLRSSSQRPILPRLIHLTLGEHGPLHPELYELLLGSSIRSVYVSIFPAVRHFGVRVRFNCVQGNMLVMDLLDLLVKRCPGLRSFRFEHYMLDVPEGTYFIANLGDTTLSSFPELQELYLHLFRIPSCLIRAVGRLQNLKILSLSGLEEEHELDETSPSPTSETSLASSIGDRPFSSVERMGLHGEPKASVAILRSVASSPLVTTLQLSVDDKADMDTLEPLTALPQLRSLVLCLDARNGAWDRFAPVLRCSGMEFVKVYCTDWTLDLDDGRIEEMARAWRKLRRLDVQCGWTNRPDQAAPDVTLEGLVSFNLYCPDLQTLVIDVDARPIPNALPPPPLNSLQTLDLGLSITGGRQNALPISRQIDKMYPNLRHLATSWSGEDPTWLNQPTELDTWRLVWEMVMSRREAREEEREARQQEEAGTVKVTTYRPRTPSRKDMSRQQQDEYYERDVGK